LEGGLWFLPCSPKNAIFMDENLALEYFFLALCLQKLLFLENSASKYFLRLENNYLPNNLLYYFH
jgi:hypothetical protein